MQYPLAVSKSIHTICEQYPAVSYSIFQYPAQDEQYPGLRMLGWPDLLCLVGSTCCKSPLAYWAVLCDRLYSAVTRAPDGMLGRSLGLGQLLVVSLNGPQPKPAPRHAYPVFLPTVWARHRCSQQPNPTPIAPAVLTLVSNHP